MKLVDEGLKKVFERSNITCFLKAYAHMINSGCYTRAEAMSNALYHFDINSINDYDLIIIKKTNNTRDMKICEGEITSNVQIYDSVAFYKLADIPHLHGYVSFCLAHENKDVSMLHEDAYTKIFEIDNINVVDFDFITQGFKGLISKTIVEHSNYSVRAGVIGEENGMEERMEHALAYDDDEEVAEAAPDEEVENEVDFDVDTDMDGMVRIRRPRNGRMVAIRPDLRNLDEYFVGNDQQNNVVEHRYNAQEFADRNGEQRRVTEEQRRLLDEYLNLTPTRVDEDIETSTDREDTMRRIHESLDRIQDLIRGRRND